jgi:alpha-L-fucosidase
VKPYTPADFRFTAKGDTLYVIGMACPTDGKATIHALGTAHEGSSIPVGNIQLLGSNEKISFTQTPEALDVTLPSSAGCKYAYTLKLTRANQ